MDEDWANIIEVGRSCLTARPSKSEQTNKEKRNPAQVIGRDMTKKLQGDTDDLGDADWEAGVR